MITQTRTGEELTMPVQIAMEGANLHADFQMPSHALGLVIFVHGSGSSRFSPRNRYMARELNKHGLATLLLDLLTPAEQVIDEQTMELRFDIPLLGSRTTQVTNWVLRHPELSHLPIGLFGASTGAAAALIAAAVMPERIAAVVSRGGRPDMGENALDVVKAPTLLIVGSQDGVVLGLNRKALERLHCVNELHVVPGATHLFEEEGAIEEVARAAADWFVRHMQVAAPAAK
jgi:pimeloyl-ACP methyl ester carboxylesterase